MSQFECASSVYIRMDGCVCVDISVHGGLKCDIKK